jgi:hypothetical protein
VSDNATTEQPTLQALADAAARWEATATVAADLAEARAASHWGAQLVAAAGATLAPPRPDDSHTSLEWLDGARALAGVPVGAGLRAALRPADLTLQVLAGDIAAWSLALPGQTMEGALRWLSGAIGKAAAPLARPRHELPAHPLGAGAPFPAVPAAAARLAAWFASADRMLRAIAAAVPEASPVRCWPHHFDIATLIALDAPATRTVGVGLSPGDGSYAEPYWYVTPWPYPAADRLPPLPAGRWHTEGWVGAVLVGSALGPARAGDQVAGFLASAIPAARRLLTS